jgi:hypothetical protein
MAERRRGLSRTGTRSPPRTKCKLVSEIFRSQVSISYPSSCDFDSQHLPATTAATSAASTAAAETSTATTETATATTEAATTTIEAATARSHAGGAAIAVGACVGSVESSGTASEGISITCTTARKISTAYAIGSARANGAVTEACIPPKAA